MRWLLVVLFSTAVITLALCRPEKKKSLLDGLGKLLKDVLITTTTTTTPAPSFVEDLINRGKHIAGQQYKAQKQKVLEKIGDYAEQAGVHRGVAQAVSSQFIDDSVKKGKAYLAQRRNSTMTVEPVQGQHDLTANHRQTDRVGHQRQQQQRQQMIGLQPAEEVIEEPVVQQKVEFKKGGYGGY